MPVQTKADLLQIGEVAERVGLSIRTLRHWEEVGLVQPTARSKGGFRLYSHADVDRLLVVKAMKPMGLALEEMAELLRLLELSRLPAAARDVRHDEVIEGLEGFARRTEERIKRIVRDLGDASTLLENISAGIRSRRVAASPPIRETDHPSQNEGLLSLGLDADDQAQAVSSRAPRAGAVR